MPDPTITALSIHERNLFEHLIFHQESVKKQPYRRIGQGFCGSVWANSPGEHSEGSPYTASKREDGGQGRSLLNDFQMHQSVLKALLECPQELVTFIVPECYAFIPAHHPGWQDGKFLARFPPGYAPCNTLITQRIPPMEEAVRHRIIERFCPQTPTFIQKQMKADDKNLDCLVRPYLGRSKHDRSGSRYGFFSLCNYPLHLNQMEDLGLPLQDYSSAMAKALAFLYWFAKIDANGIDFVLAPPPHSSTGDAQFTSDFLGDHSLWIFDFDCCRPMTLDDAGVERAARAFLRSDPFYPHPGRTNNRRLWEQFRTVFIESSKLLVNHEARDLPKQLMGKIEEMAESNEADNAGNA